MLESSFVNSVIAILFFLYNKRQCNKFWFFWLNKENFKPFMEGKYSLNSKSMTTCL